MSDNRGVYSKYSPSVAGSILKSVCKNIGELLYALETKVNKDEVICISQLKGDWFYITIENEKIIQHPKYIRCCFTVDIKLDKIMWNDGTQDNISGGNCFVRAPKWKAFVTNYFGKDGIKEKIKFYTD